jgi:hypothetical protein
MAQTLMDRAISSGDPEALLYDIDGFPQRVISSARITSSDLNVKVQMIKFKDSLPPIVEPGPIDEMDIQPLYTFLSEDRHSNTTPEDLSERWGLSVAQAALTLKATTRRMIPGRQDVPALVAPGDLGD